MITFPRCLSRQCGGGLTRPRSSSVPRCLEATFGGGIYRYKHKHKLCKQAMSFKTLLLQLLCLLLTFTITMSNVRVLEDEADPFRQDRILMEFLPHTNKEYEDFGNSLQEAYDIEVNTNPI